MTDTKNVIIHGDSRNYVPKIKTPINAVITDPPYGMNFRSNRAVTPDGKQLNQEIAGDMTTREAIETFHSIMGVIIPKLAPLADIYVFTAWHVLQDWIPAVQTLNSIDEKGDPFANRNNGIELKQMLLWEKGYPGQGDLEANWGCGHEVILYLKKGRRPINFRRSGILHVHSDDLLDQEIKELEWRLDLLNKIKDGALQPGPLETGFIPIDKIPARQNIHPTEKPVPLIEWLIKASTNHGDFIVDPYSGSGSTSVAAQNLGRNSLAFELREDYVLKSRERLTQQGFVFD